MATRRINWRAPRDVAEWLERQPGGISFALEMLCRVAMREEAQPAIEQPAPVSRKAQEEAASDEPISLW